MSCEGEITKKLSNRGFRVTPQRREILHILLHAQKHLTPTEIFEEAHLKLPHLTETTVYRTLEFLAQVGLAQEAFSATSKSAYEISDYTHHHLICRKCGQDVEIPHVKLDTFCENLETETGFQLMQNHLSFFGLCPTCQKGH